MIHFTLCSPNLFQWKSVERLGATVVLEGDSYDEAQSYAKLRCEQEGRTFIPPFDHPDVITGQGTVGMEIVRQLQGPLHAIFVPVGGGGLIAGIAAYVKRVRPEVSFPSYHFFRKNNPMFKTTTCSACHHGDFISAVELFLLNQYCSAILSTIEPSASYLMLV
jgi:hypothetical protein